MSLEQYSDQELKDELAARSKNIWNQFKAWLEENVDVLLLVHTEHGLVKCSDEDPNNFHNGRCTRCFLLDVKKYGYCDEDSIPHYNPGYFTFTELENGDN